MSALYDSANVFERNHPSSAWLLRPALTVRLRTKVAVWNWNARLITRLSILGKESLMVSAERGKTVLNAQDARQGKELGVMRYVLVISLALACIAGLVLYAIFH